MGPIIVKRAQKSLSFVFIICKRESGGGIHLVLPLPPTAYWHEWLTGDHKYKNVSINGCILHTHALWRTGDLSRIYPMSWVVWAGISHSNSEQDVATIKDQRTRVHSETFKWAVFTKQRLRTWNTFTSLPQNTHKLQILNIKQEVLYVNLDTFALKKSEMIFPVFPSQWCCFSEIILDIHW